MNGLRLAAGLLIAATFAFAGCGDGDDPPGSSSGGGGGGGGGQIGNTATANELSLAQQVFVLVNQERATVSLPALTYNDPLAQVAYDHSWDMDSRDFFSHDNPDGLDPFDRMANQGVTFSSAGENIAAGQTTAASVMTSWMNSQGHKDNILSANYTEIGIGVKETTMAGSFSIYWTQNFRSP